MKVTGIELLQKIKNGEIKQGTEFLTENKTKIYFDGYILRYKNNYCGIKTDKEIGMSWLKGEFELIEENKEIKELEKISYDEFIYSGNKHRFDLTIKEYDKINELVRAVNKLIKESEEK